MGRNASIIRSRVPIMAYVGGNGGGKTLCMVNDTLGALERGRRVLSTVRLLDDNGNPHPAFEPLVDWQQVMNARNCDILLDEVTGVASSRDFAKMPPQLLQRMVQLRKAHCRIRWTSPNFARADVVLREVTRAVTVCKGYFPQYVTDDEGTVKDPFGSRRLFRWVTFPAEDFDTFEAGATDKLKKIVSEYRWRGKSMEAQRRYDTHEECLVLTHLDETGSCVRCGGHRTKPKCRCTDDERAALRESLPIAGSHDSPAAPTALRSVTTSSGTRIVHAAHTAPSPDYDARAASLNRIELPPL